MSVEPAASLLLDRLRDSGLLEPDQLEELARLPEAQDPHPAPLGKALLQRGWLTRFQVNTVANGRGKDLFVGPYLILDRVGEGGMGQVYKAQHRHMNRVVALKVIKKEKLANPDSVKRFYQEVQVAAQLSHPNIVMAYDAGQADSTHYLAMEFVDGSDLAQLVKDNGPLPVAAACDYVRQAALGLQHAHEKGLVHRDIKPHNLLMTRAGAAGDSSAAGRAALLTSASQSGSGGVVKILDMGLARLQAGGEKEKALTQTGAVIGTPEYLSPEQAVNSRKADIRSDLYSLGCTFYFLLTGKPPFQAESLTQVLLLHQMGDADSLGKHRADIPAPVQAVARKLISREPEKRYQTPAEVVKALEPFCQDNGAPAPPARMRAAEAQPNSWATLGGDEPAVAAAKDSPTQEIIGERVPRMAGKERRRDRSGPPAQPRRSKQTDNQRLLLIACIGGGAALLLLLAGLGVWMLLSSKPKPASTPPDDGPPLAKPGVEPAAVADQPALPPAGASPLDRLDPTRIAPEDRYEGLPELTAVLKGHTGEVFSLVFAPDGKVLASSGADGTFRLWDLTGTEPRPRGVVDGKGGWITSLSFSPDGKKVAIGTKNRYDVQIWDVSGPEIRPAAVVPGRNPPKRSSLFSGIRGLFSPDGKTLVVSDDTELRVLDLTGPEPVERPTARGSRPVGWIALSRDGRTVASTNGDRTLRLWDLTASPPVEKGTVGAPQSLMGMAFSPDGRALAAGCMDGTVCVWDLSGPEPNRQPRTIKAHQKWANSVAFSPDGKVMVSTEGGASLTPPSYAIEWDPADLRKRREWRMPERCSCGTFDPSGRYLALTSHNRKVYVLRLPPP